MILKRFDVVLVKSSATITRYSNLGVSWETIKTPFKATVASLPPSGSVGLCSEFYGPDMVYAKLDDLELIKGDV